MGPASASWIANVSRYVFAMVVCVQLAGCQHTENYAPVVDISATESHDRPHVVSRVVSRPEKPVQFTQFVPVKLTSPKHIAHLDVPVKPAPVQIQSVKHAPVSMNIIATPAKPKLPSDDVPSWVSPANGRIVALYSAKHRGIDISGQLGDPIYAISSGNIAYAGNGLRGYGNLIIIKHNNEYLSTYAYNKSIKVKAGERVKKGQIIGQMGYKDKNRVMLYFELRRRGRPIDPLSIRGIMN